MSLDSLAELVSATGNAVKSMDKSDSSSGSNRLGFINAGSPFDSPRSLRSLSEKDAQSCNTDSGVGRTQTKSRAISGAKQNTGSDGDETGLELEEDATVIEVIPCLPVTTSSSGKQSDSLVEKFNISSTSSQKLSISKKHLREIESPVGDALEQTSHSSVSSHNSARSKSSNGQEKHGHRAAAVSHIERNKEYVNANNNRTDKDDERGSSATASSFSDQPEIIDIHERVVAITSGMSATSDDDSALNLIGKVEEANQPAGTRDVFFGHKSFGKTINALGHTLKQGAPNKGVMDPTKASLSDDVQISQFGLTEKQRGLKEALAKRSENNKPKKKFVQPQIIRNKFYNDEDTDRDSEKGRSSSAPLSTTATDPAVAAAVAASAAIAATQPFLKAQHDLETRMQELLAQLTELQQKKSSTSEGGRTVDSENRIMDLERQVAELNERRFEHLENLQQQQLQMQAQLLFMTRSRSPSGQTLQSKRKASPPRPYQASRIPQAISKSFQPAPSHSNIMPAQYMYQPNIPFSHSMYNQSMHSQPSFNPATLSKHHNYLNEVRELQGSHLDTPAPRDKVPKPTPYTLPQEPQKSLGFLEELLAQNKEPGGDTTFSVRGGYSPKSKLDSDRNNSARGRTRGDKSPVDKARQLVNSLSNLEKETADSLWGSREGLNKVDMMDVDLGPAPLERYLKYPAKEGSPYPKLGHHSKEKKSRLHNLENLLEAKSVLRQLESTRETLEKNIDQVVRSRRDMHVFSTLLGSAPEGTVDEQLRIEKMVNKKITALQGDVQREVLRGLAQEEADKLAAQAEAEKQKLMAKKNLAKSDTARSGTLKGQAERSARLAYSKSSTLTSRNVAVMDKENRASKVKPVPKPAAIKDPATMARTYGKPDYQRGRTTIRDPYLHFQNTKRGVAGKSSVTNLNESTVSRDGRSRSPKGRLGQGQVMTPTPRQFYFSPTRGYIPLSAGDTAPLPGQMVSMAIPLGEPRLEPGVRRSATTLMGRTSDPVTSTPVPVTAARNVAMVSFPVEDEMRRGHEREPELAKQVLPPIDIDSISPSSSRRTDIHIGSPQQGNANVTFLYDTRDEIDELDKTFTEEDSDMEQSGQGIKLPGYEPKTSEYSGPNFPPRTSKPPPGWMTGGGEGAPGQLVSDIMAEDLRRRDLVENNAVEWLEQELMARILSQIMPVEVPDRVGDLSKALSVKSDDSDREESLMVADMIGQDGMQLFIDAGQPVDNSLVQALVKEVIQEKVNIMLAQRSAEGEGQAGAKVKDEVQQVLEEREREKIHSGPPRVPTPEPTPKSSPVPSPRRIRQQPPQPTTPPLSPPPDGYRFKPAPFEPEVLPEPVKRPPSPEPQVAAPVVESESETSVSIDISEELRRVAGQGKPSEPAEPLVMRHDVATPPISPPPMAEEERQPTLPPRQATPPSSPPPAAPPRARTPSPPRKEPVREEVEEETEEEEEEELEQPKPILMSIGVGDDRPMTAESQTQRRSPSPKRPRTPVSTVSETSPPSTDSSVTETVNDILSEGQWLLSRSEGQVMGRVNYEAIRKELIQRGYHPQPADLSTASTLRDTDDLDLDAEGNKSEGEFLYAGLPDPDKDPMLEVLAEMQKKPLAAYRDLPGSHVRQILSGPAPREVMSNTGRSIGEMSVGQVPPSRVAMGKTRREGERRQKGRRSPQRSPSPKMERSLEEEYRYEGERRERRQQRSRTPSPLQQQQHQQELQRSRTPPPHQERRIRTPPAQQGALRGRTRGQMQYQPVLSEGAPIATRGRTPLGPGMGRRSSDSRLSQSSDPGRRRSASSYQSDSVSRSAESPSLRKSADGVLTSSFKSRGSGVKKSVEFDLTGTYGRSDRSSLRGSNDVSGRLSDPNRSLGLTYSFEDSLDESELKRIVGSTGSGTGPYRMSVTIPSTANEEESELSELDLSDK